MKKIILSLLLMSFSGAFGQQPVLKEFIIGDAKTACFFNNTITSCLKIKFHPDSNWKEFPYDIEGFIFEPGTETRVAVHETPVLNAEADGPAFRYKLVKVLETKSTVLTSRLLLMNNKWKILNLEKDLALTPARKAGAFIEFNPDSGEIGGFGGCNRFGGDAEIIDGTITFGNIFSTKMSCQNDEIENMILEGMKGKAAYYVRNNILFVVCENRMTIHLRAEKRIDSLVRELQSPKQLPAENEFVDLKDGHFNVMLPQLPETVHTNMIFKKGKLTPEESKTCRFKLVNISMEDTVAEIKILKTPHKTQGLYYATVVLRNGETRSVTIRNR